jgi:hypothetical protein
MQARAATCADSGGGGGGRTVGRGAHRGRGTAALTKAPGASPQGAGAPALTEGARMVTPMQGTGTLTQGLGTLTQGAGDVDAVGRGGGADAVGGGRVGAQTQRPACGPGSEGVDAEARHRGGGAARARARGRRGRGRGGGHWWRWQHERKWNPHPLAFEARMGIGARHSSSHSVTRVHLWSWAFFLLAYVDHSDAFCRKTDIYPHKRAPRNAYVGTQSQAMQVTGTR